MNKIIIALILLQVFTICNAGDDGEDIFTNGKMWERCQEQLTNLSIYWSANSDKANDLSNLFLCAYVWYTSDGRKACEDKYGLSSADEKVKTFYNDCAVPAYEEVRDTSKPLSNCAEERDKCQLCIDSETCKTHSHYGKWARVLDSKPIDSPIPTIPFPENPSNGDTNTNVMPKSAELAAIQSKSSEDNCVEKPSQKCSVDTLKQLAYMACTDYYFDKCEKEYYEANFQDDPCYDYNTCMNSGVFLKIAFISIIAFFAF